MPTESGPCRAQKMLGVVINLLRRFRLLFCVILLIPFTRASWNELGAKQLYLLCGGGSALYLRYGESSSGSGRAAYRGSTVYVATTWAELSGGASCGGLSQAFSCAAIPITTILALFAMAACRRADCGTIAIKLGYYRYQTDMMLWLRWCFW